MIGTQQLEGNTRAAVFLLVAVAIALCGAMLAHKLSLGIAVASVLAIIIFPFSFVSTEIALYMLIFSMLLGPQLSVGGGDEVTAARGRGVALRADDILIAVIGLSWFLRVAINKELGFFLRTPLNVPIAVYFLICIVATAGTAAWSRCGGATSTTANSATGRCSTNPISTGMRTV